MAASATLRVGCRRPANVHGGVVLCNSMLQAKLDTCTTMCATSAAASRASGSGPAPPGGVAMPSSRAMPRGVPPPGAAPPRRGEKPKRASASSPRRMAMMGLTTLLCHSAAARLAKYSRLLAQSFSAASARKCSSLIGVATKHTRRPHWRNDES